MSLRDFGHRLGGAMASLLLVFLLLVALVAWIAETRPRHLSQLPVPAVELSSFERAAAQTIPPYRNVIPVLSYHAVSDNESRPTTIRVALFARQMAALAEAGFHTVGLSAADAMLRGQPVRLPSRPILLTFDDGLVSDWTRVDPILQAHGFSAVAFLITGSIAPVEKKSEYLNVDQLRALARSGRWEFAGHSHGLHRYQLLPGSGWSPVFDHLVPTPAGPLESHAQWAARVAADLRASQAFFRAQLGTEATAFAYPFSATGDRGSDPTIGRDLRVLLRSAGYHLAFSGELTGDARAVWAGDDPFRLSRLSVRPALTVAGLLQQLHAMVPSPMPGDLTTIPWVGQGGQCDVLRSAVPFAIRLTTHSFGTCVGDVNAVDWRDYQLTVDVWIPPGTTAVLALRVSQPLGHGRGRAEVAVGQSSLQLRRVLPDRVEVLARMPLPPRAGSNLVAVRHLDVSVQGSVLGVRVDYAPVVAAPFGPGLDSGGVFFSAGTRDLASVLFAAPRIDPLPPLSSGRAG
jgi:peptidoglycan/xylan/chitin deacetylase (PgdA/CDA1 family)